GAIHLLQGMFGGAVVLPSFLESKLGFLGLTQINGVAVSFGKWAEAIQSSSMVVMPSVLGALLLCLVCKNSIEVLRTFTPRLMTLIFSILLFYTALFTLGMHTTTEFLYFNF
ncbi:MAG TPA: MBOAT family protein, partial [Candidatus Helicobacter avicola]|nr:MBOAT family protein [Candidatus Helicobacter avicola]